MAHNTISPVFSNFDAISFLQTEFGKNYSDFYNKFTKKQYKINKLFSFYHYKNFAIVSLFLIYDYEEYIKYLNYNNLPIINFSL